MEQADYYTKNVNMNVRKKPCVYCYKDILSTIEVSLCNSLVRLGGREALFEYLQNNNWKELER